MKQITHVKLSHGEIINITTTPKEGHHYKIDGDTLWVIPNYQATRAEYMQTKVAGVIIAQGVNEKEVDIIMPPEFQHYRMWCDVHGFKKHDANTLSTYTKRFLCERAW